MSATAAKNQASTSKSSAAGRTGKDSKPSAKTKRASAKSTKPAAKTTRSTAGPKIANKDGGKRLSPGQLEGMVLGYMKKNRSKLPVTAGTIGRGIKRSSGAVANCLGRLEKASEVRLTNKQPRKYELAGKASK